MDGDECWKPSVIPNALPPPVVEAWRAELADSARAQEWKIYKWLRHREQDPQVDLVSQTIEAACRALSRSSAAFASTWAESAGVEVWAQCRAAGNGMHFHWDVDEALGRMKGETRCPWLSVVCYLSSAGGPTLCIDQRPQDAFGRIVRHALAWPVAGSLFAMPGNRLHGVLAEIGAPTAGDAVRFTLILNFWHAQPLGAKTPRAGLAPAAALVIADDASAGSCAAAGGEGARRRGVVVTLLDSAEGEWREEEALAAAASFCSAPPPLVAITAFETRSVWLGMHNRADELEVWLPPLDFENRGAGADLVEWCNTCRLIHGEEEA